MFKEPKFSSFELRLRRVNALCDEENLSAEQFDCPCLATMESPAATSKTETLGPPVLWLCLAREKVEHGGLKMGTSK